MVKLGYCLKFNKRSIVPALKCIFGGLRKILITNMLECIVQFAV